MSPGGRRTGRRPGSADTRGRILDAARVAFGERGYDGASVRQIAADAGVDPALVHHYFGPKQRLFVAAMTFPVDPAVALPRLLAAGPSEELGERFVRFVVDPVGPARRPAARCGCRAIRGVGPRGGDDGPPAADRGPAAGDRHRDLDA